MFGGTQALSCFIYNPDVWKKNNIDPNEKIYPEHQSPEHLLYDCSAGQEYQSAKLQGRHGQYWVKPKSQKVVVICNFVLDCAP